MSFADGVHRPASDEDLGVKFVGELPKAANRNRKSRWREVRDALKRRPGEWALIDSPGGYPRQRLQDLGCEVRQTTIDGERRLYAKWPA